MSPPTFKAKVETRLKAAVAAYQKVSDMSANTPDADKLMAEHAKAVTAMNAVFDLFPADLRPDPNTPPGRGRSAEKLIVARVNFVRRRSSSAGEEGD